MRVGGGRQGGRSKGEETAAAVPLPTYVCRRVLLLCLYLRAAALPSRAPPALPDGRGFWAAVVFNAEPRHTVFPPSFSFFLKKSLELLCYSKASLTDPFPTGSPLGDWTASDRTGPPPVYTAVVVDRPDLRGRRGREGGSAGTPWHGRRIAAVYPRWPCGGHFDGRRLPLVAPARAANAKQRLLSAPGISPFFLLLFFVFRFSLCHVSGLAPTMRANSQTQPLPLFLPHRFFLSGSFGALPLSFSLCDRPIGGAQWPTARRPDPHSVPFGPPP